MATLALAAAGAAVGGALAPAGITILGATLTGATIGSQIGALAGSVIDQALLGASGQSRTVQGPRLSELRVTASSEGAPIPRLYGRARLGGQVIWATNLEEEVIQNSQGSSGGGKGGLGGAGGGTTTIEYRYYANFAVAIAEGSITGLGRVWADGNELDLSTVTSRLYLGTADQPPDSLIVTKEGDGNAPAYRGLAYIVFERLALAPFGNRLPQLSFEVHRAVDTFEAGVRAVTMIPGAGEFIYSPTAVSRRVGSATNIAENVHTLQGGTDWTVSLDQLQATLPNVANVSLVVGWFGTDLRAAECQIRPGVDSADKVTAPLTWSVAGLDRGSAHLISLHDDRAAYGGTPSDSTVVEAIRDLSDERGLGVTLSPFLYMDVPEDNTLPNPYGGDAQPAYPWRGRVTVSPAAGQPDTADQTPDAATQVEAFVGTAAPSDFAVVGETVIYTGPAEWSYRRFILHYAHLAAAAGGVDAFIIGSELRGLTQVRDSADTYPFVAALVALAADVKSILPGAKVTYAADWSEYFGHQPPDGSGDVYFNLDPLWSSEHIDAIGIDVYWPLADWRDGTDHLDRLAGASSVYDLAYLTANITGGEGYDFYYASSADRDAQVRSPITDGGAGKPWTFRYKDIKGWWENQHFNRPGGVESGTPTAWTPRSKPFWFTEFGCPAIDKGANQPNVFIDPKSSESHLPYYSAGTRDDFMQRRYLQAFHTAFNPDDPSYVEGTNPTSDLYDDDLGNPGRMLDLAHMHVYTWDARPYPAFPANADTWGDSPNWRLGHWITGRLASAPLDATVATLLADYAFAAHDARSLTGLLTGLVIDRVLSAREALQPLELAFFLDARESGGAIVFSHRGAGASLADLDDDSLVEQSSDQALATMTRAQETDLPASAKLTYISASGTYPAAVEEARRLAGRSGRVATADLPVVLEPERAARMAETWLFEAWAARERAQFSLPPSRLALEPGDLVTLASNGRSRLLRITDIGEHGVRDIEARGIDPDVYFATAPALRRTPGGPAVVIGQPLALFLDLPLIRGDEPAHAGYVAAAQSPWPGGIAFYRSPETSGFLLKALARVPAVTGVTIDPVYSGVTSLFERGNTFRVALDQGSLASVTDLALLGGANTAAIQNEDGAWEVLQFANAELTAPGTYLLSTLLRGQFGTETAMRDPVATGARFVLLDGVPTLVDMTPDDVGLAYNWKAGPASRDIGHPSYVAAQHAFTGRGLVPLRPAHVRGSRTADDLTITWVRRTRIGGDSWDSVEVPLGEDAERYEVDILDGADVVRTLASTSATVTYTAADQTDDFGAPQSSVLLRVYQLSATAGRGTPRPATL